MKKKFLFLAILPLLMVAYLFSCQKSDDLTKETAIPSKDEPNLSHKGDEGITTRSGVEYDYADCPYQLGLVTKVNGRLVFQNEEHFEKCALCLEHQYGAYNDAFNALYPNATAEQLDGYAASTNFNEWGSYISFESGLGFSSLRAKILTESDAFLASTPAATINLNLDPDVLCPVVRNSDRALLNENGEVMIGSTLKTKEDWANKSFTDACSSLWLNQQEFTESDNPVLVDRKLKVWIWVQSGTVVSKLVGKMKYYKKNDNGHFRSNVRADMRIHVQGNAFDNECRSTLSEWGNTDGWKKRTHLQVTATTPFMLWLEAFTDMSDPMWMTEASFVSAELFSNQNFFFRALSQ